MSVRLFLAVTALMGRGVATTNLSLCLKPLLLLQILTGLSILGQPLIRACGTEFR
jgi:hypothetical protein